MARFNAACRSRAAERMDSPHITYGDMQSCLRDLEKVNIATRGYRPTLRWLNKAAHSREPDRPLRILDIGCGGGDGLRQIWRWARKRGIDVELTGVDLSPHACRFARSRTPAAMPVTFMAADIFRFEPEEPVDLIINSLLTHHLGEPEIIALLQWMETRAAIGWFINDLHRHWLPYHFIRLAAAGFRLDPMVCHDAPVSVARGFTRQEWYGLLTQADIPMARACVQWFFPFRHGVSCIRR